MCALRGQVISSHLIMALSPFFATMGKKSHKMVSNFLMDLHISIFQAYVGDSLI